MTAVIFATNDPAEAEKRMRASNSKLSDDTISRIRRLVESGAIRVGDPLMHSPGSIFADRELLIPESDELAAIAKQAVAETLGAGR